MIFTVVLEGVACVFRSALDDLAAGPPTRRRCVTGNHLLGLVGPPISGNRDVMPRRRIWVPRALGSSLGWVFVGDGDELGNSSMPPSRPSLVG
jgi:hypothetical protein